MYTWWVLNATCQLTLALLYGPLHHPVWSFFCRDGCDLFKSLAMRKTRGGANCTSYVWQEYCCFVIFCNFPVARDRWSKRKRAMSGVGTLRNFLPWWRGDPCTRRDHPPWKWEVFLGLCTLLDVFPNPFPQFGWYILQLIFWCSILPRWSVIVYTYRKYIVKCYFFVKIRCYLSNWMFRCTLWYLPVKLFNEMVRKGITY